ncbi:MAG TPA: hypothetical protein VF134_07315 [Candidatus Dormibacteraeota bacterium]
MGKDKPLEEDEQTWQKLKDQGWVKDPPKDPSPAPSPPPPPKASPQSKPAPTGGKPPRASGHKTAKPKPKPKPPTPKPAAQPAPDAQQAGTALDDKGQPHGLFGELPPTDRPFVGGSLQDLFPIPDPPVAPPEPQFDPPGGPALGPDLDTGHYDDGHAFGWKMKGAKPAEKPPEAAPPPPAAKPKDTGQFPTQPPPKKPDKKPPKSTLDDLFKIPPDQPKSGTPAPTFQPTSYSSPVSTGVYSEPLLPPRGFLGRTPVPASCLFVAVGFLFFLFGSAAVFAECRPVYPSASPYADGLGIFDDDYFPGEASPFLFPVNVHVAVRHTDPELAPRIPDDPTTIWDWEGLIPVDLRVPVLSGSHSLGAVEEARAAGLGLSALECGDHAGVLTVCRQPGALPPGRYWIGYQRLRAAPPANISQGYYQYGLVFGDGNPADGYVPNPDNNDFFKGAIVVNALIYDATRPDRIHPWTLYTQRQVNNQPVVTNSAARVIMNGRSLIWVIPMDDVNFKTPTSRMTSFFSPSTDFGISPPHQWSGLESPPVNDFTKLSNSAPVDLQPGRPQPANPWLVIAALVTVIGLALAAMGGAWYLTSRSMPPRPAG